MYLTLCQRASIMICLSYITRNTKAILFNIAFCYINVPCSKSFKFYDFCHHGETNPGFETLLSDLSGPQFLHNRRLANLVSFTVLFLTNKTVLQSNLTTLCTITKKSALPPVLYLSSLFCHNTEIPDKLCSYWCTKASKGYSRFTENTPIR